MEVTNELVERPCNRVGRNDEIVQERIRADRRDCPEVCAEVRVVALLARESEKRIARRARNHRVRIVELGAPNSGAREK